MSTHLGPATDRHNPETPKAPAARGATAVGTTAVGTTGSALTSATSATEQY